MHMKCYLFLLFFCFFWLFLKLYAICKIFHFYSWILNIICFQIHQWHYEYSQIWLLPLIKLLTLPKILTLSLDKLSIVFNQNIQCITDLWMTGLLTFAEKKSQYVAFQLLRSFIVLSNFKHKSVQRISSTNQIKKTTLLIKNWHEQDTCQLGNWTYW